MAVAWSSMLRAACSCSRWSSCFKTGWASGMGYQGQLWDHHRAQRAITGLGQLVPEVGILVQEGLDFPLLTHDAAVHSLQSSSGSGIRMSGCSGCGLNTVVPSLKGPEEVMPERLDLRNHLEGGGSFSSFGHYYRDLPRLDWGQTQVVRATIRVRIRVRDRIQVEWKQFRGVQALTLACASLPVNDSNSSLWAW